MAFGGGSFIAQNKILPGSYINFVSVGKASADLSERGVAAMPLTLSWGPEETVFTVTNNEFLKNCREIFGYGYSAPEMQGLRELFLNARAGVFYRLGTGGVKAGNTLCTAKYPGVCGNKITIVVEENMDSSDENPLFDVKTLIDGVSVDMQKGVSSGGALLSNDFVDWKGDSLFVTSGMPLAGGVDGVVTEDDYARFLDRMENYAFHTLGLPSTDPAICAMFKAFTKRMRDEVGAKFQTVLYCCHDSDYEGIISVENTLEKGGPDDGAALVYWVTGAQAGCPVNRTLTARKYNGELSISADMTQVQLENALKKGAFVFQRTGESIRVLKDNNTYVSFNTDKNADFADNQVIRVLDQIGNDIAVLFNERYLGKVPNDEAGRTGLWNDIVTHHRQLETLRAIENFDSEDILVEQGKNKQSVTVSDRITPVCAMTQLYMTVMVE